MNPDTFDGNWIAPAGEYQNLARQLCGSDPRLRQPDEKMTRYGVHWETRPCRVLVFQMPAECPDGETPDFTPPAFESHEFNNPETLKQFLRLQKHQDEAGRQQPRKNTVLIVEGLNRGFAGVLGPHFDLHPSMFMDYERVTTVATAPDRGQSSLLASNMATRGYLLMSYQELIALPEPAQNHFRVRCPDTARLIRSTRLNGKFSKVGMMHRRCVFWSRVARSTDSVSWESIVICDPPLRRVRILDEGPAKGHEFAVKLGPPGDGYVDFLPLEIQAQSCQGPPRTSLAEDLAFYITLHHGLVDRNSPDGVSLFLKKIVASHYTKHFDFLRRHTTEMLRGMGRQSHFAWLDLSAVESNWSDTQTLERRLGHFCIDLEEILVQLRIPLEAPDLRATTSWHDVEADFRLLHHRYAYIRDSVDRVNASITGLAGIAGNRQAFKEQQLSLTSAERSRKITFIGLAFIPLTFTSALFSMTEPYGPGQDQFWLYFAVSIPLSIVVIASYYVNLVSSNFIGRYLATSEPTTQSRTWPWRTWGKPANQQHIA